MAENEAKNKTALLAKNPLAKELVNKLLYEALQPLVSKNDTELHIKVGRRNLALEILMDMEVVK